MTQLHRFGPGAPASFSVSIPTPQRLAVTVLLILSFGAISEAQDAPARRKTFRVQGTQPAEEATQPAPQDNLPPPRPASEKIVIPPPPPPPPAPPGAIKLPAPPLRPANTADGKDLTKTATDADTVIVTVDGASLTRGDAQRQVEETLAALSRSGRPVPKEHRVRQKAQRYVVDSFIAGTLLENEAKRRGIAVDKAAVQKAIDQRAKPAENEADQPTASEKDLRKTIERNLRIRALIDSVTKGQDAVTAAEVKSFYKKNRQRFRTPEQARARHILIEYEEKDDRATRKAKKARLAALRQRIAAGEDFAELAAEHSACPSAANGGDLGFVPRGSMSKPFEKALFSQEIGEVGKTVETRFGCHIVQVLARRESTIRSLEEGRAQIETHLQAERKRKATRDLVQTLRKSASIVFHKRNE
ncbi:MAG: hypothetical protein HN742_38340 [Lentisphaerae bacterium]|jgi:peptidyl-prolyl cis-trans isomerase C|nr:hypothetical protein [Lentisphaerota bacterium]MBT4817736.1 hypothetical protein [Lentisphaerota bacterium]MBT5609302.1 hypothetical protein [Lentisphaerota bacterium]MBT7059404.1 hypothetical protein [Lentisphaerota bacterium]MBT7847788.1 hypothetical protein [Lentisphaerota bacterium]